MKASFLTNDHDMFRKALRKMLEKEVYPFFKLWEDKRHIPKEFWLKAW